MGAWVLSASLPTSLEEGGGFCPKREEGWGVWESDVISRGLREGPSAFMHVLGWKESGIWRGRPWVRAVNELSLASSSPLFLPQPQVLRGRGGARPRRWGYEEVGRSYLMSSSRSASRCCRV